MIYDHVAGRLSDLDREVVAAVPPGGNWRDLPQDFPSARVEQIRRSAAAGEGSRSTYYGRLHPDRPAYTISTYFNRPGNGCFIHPVFDRLITVREAARLQGFPDSFRFAGGGRARFVQVGNAVPPLLAYHLARTFPCGTAVDLFAGAGGLGQGFAWAGFDLLAAIDCDPSAVEANARNHHGRDAAMTADLGSPEGVAHALREIRNRAGHGGIDILLGGPPCQGFSTAGKALKTDPRNDLVFSFVAVAEQLLPRYVVMENVAALIWKRGRPILEAVRRRLHDSGYHTDVRLLHAETFGLPQLRRRLILVGSRDGEITWPNPTHAVVSPAYPAYQPGIRNDLPPPPGVLDAIGDLPLAAATQADAAVGYATDASTPYQRWARGELQLDQFAPDAATTEAEPQMTPEGLAA